MAQAKFYNKTRTLLSSIVSKNTFSSKVDGENRKVDIEDTKRFSRIVKEKNYPISRLIDNDRTVIITEQLPFRIKFTTIGIESYGPSNPPPIGIAIIGYNNYIL